MRDPVIIRSNDGDRDLDSDDAQLGASGYKREMPRQFSMFSLLALSYALSCTWNGFASAIGGGLSQGSSSGTIFMLLPAATMILVVSLGMAELTSAFPVAGGQYYWAFVLSPPSYAPLISYTTAAVTVIGTWLGAASTSNFISGMILSIVQFIHPEYVVYSWHKYLLYVGVIILASLLNIVGSQILPVFNKCIFAFSLATYFVTMITMLVCSYPNYNSFEWVFKDTAISTGWTSHPYAWTLCFVNSLYGFLGTDSGAHMTEEIPNPSVNGPKVIIYPVLIGLVTVIPFACTCMFVIKDMDAILNAPSGLPLIQLYHQATGSRLITVCLMIAFTLCFFACAVAIITGSSRTLWSAARDDCFPRSDVWKQLYGLVFVESESAFALMVSASIIFLVSSYVIPQAILLFFDRNELLPERNLDLGRYGYAVNLFSTLSTLLLVIACCLPTAFPITYTNMNYNRIRRVKCDETKPLCTRCQSSGRQCDGYLPENVLMSRQELVEAARNLRTVVPMSQALTQRPPSPVSFKQPADVPYFDAFRHATVPGTSFFFPSSFWQHTVTQMAHSEPAIWNATVALGALHQRSEALLQGIEDDVNILLDQASVHYGKAMTMAKDLHSPETIAATAIALVAVANMLERWSEMHMHVMAGFRIISGNVARVPGLLALEGSLARSDLQAMTFSDSQCPYPYERSSAVFPTHEYLASPITVGGSYEELARELFRLMRALFLLDNNTPPASAQHGPWLTNFEVFHRRLASWELKMEEFESLHWPTDDERTARLAIRLYHVTLRTLLRGTAFGPETRWDALLGYFEYAAMLATSLNEHLRTTAIPNISLEPGLIIPLWMISHRCRHPTLRRVAINMMAEAKRIEGMWMSDATAQVMRTILTVEEESVDLSNVHGSPPLRLDTPSLVVPWHAWSRPGFDIPTTLSWSDVPAIPEMNRVKELLGTKRVGKRSADLRLLMGSGDDGNPFGLVREISISF
ncbi:unnamed protein product [Clonostachys rosea]|uniref:Zn(2)-C6 fungal-type domain-containing protein n=1 Tax=Bionectria ochroleuca TaxID=29856 RepID=A0ABY6U5A8_BIOOC|nr:unnamed protein product [Clonostachys rosea]